MKRINIEGFEPEELLALPASHWDKLVFTGTPLLFHAGSAQILGEFAIQEGRLVVELAQIEGGGEGVLPTLWLLAGRLAAQRELTEVEWIVHAVSCAQPNPKLQRLLDRRGFQVRDVPGRGQAFYLLHAVGDDPERLHA